MKSFSASLTFLVALLLIHTSLTEGISSEAPIIGVISTPSDFKYPAKYYSYMTAAIPRYIERSGGKPIYIPYDLPEEQLFRFLNSVNGILYVGGGAVFYEEDPITGKRAFTPFMERMKVITSYIKKKNDNGVHLPLFGICQGFEVIGQALTNDPYVLDVYEDFRNHGPLQLIETGRMFKEVSQSMEEYILKRGTLYYTHEYSFNLSSFSKYPDVQNSLRVTAIAKDRNGKVFNAASEGKDWPLYMTMFHPERVVRESEDNTFKQASENVEFVLQLGRFFVKEATRNTQNFSSPKEWEKYDVSLYEPIALGTPASPLNIFVATREGDLINPKKRQIGRL